MAAFAYEKIGRIEDARRFYDRYKIYADNDNTIYQHLALAAYYASQRQVEKGIEHFKAFTEVKGMPYWFILFIKDDPILNLLNGHPDYDKIIKTLDDNFWKEHEEVKKELSKAAVIIQ